MDGWSAHRHASRLSTGSGRGRTAWGDLSHPAVEKTECTTQRSPRDWWLCKLDTRTWVPRPRAVNREPLWAGGSFLGAHMLHSSALVPGLHSADGWWLVDYPTGSVLLLPLCRDVAGLCGHRGDPVVWRLPAGPSPR